ncbi:hypothetical protein [Halomonas sp.]
MAHYCRLADATHIHYTTAANINLPLIEAFFVQSLEMPFFLGTQR